MANKAIYGVVTVAVLAVAGWAIWGRGGSETKDIEYRYQKLERGNLTRSISGVGQLVADTKVDIRSKAGGKIIRLAVEEGDVVKKGDLIAVIDPDDTQTLVDQANADLASAAARADSARINAGLERVNRANAVREAEVAVETARIRLSRIESQAKAQPTLSSSELRNAEAALTAQREALRTMTDVEVPRIRKEAQTGADRARSEMDTARAELDRFENLLKQEFVSQSEVDAAKNRYEVTRAAHANAQERLRTVEREIDLMLSTQRARVAQADAALKSAGANQNRVIITQKDLEEARQSLASAQLDLDRAQNDLAQADIRAADRRGAEASMVRSRVSLRNAQVQLNETTVVAPRDGVVTRKYLEEGTIIPPGTSTFSQGTAIVELSDVTQMFVEVAVDEADIAQVSVGQRVKILVEAFPRMDVEGVVDRIHPAAQTEQNITAIKVRVRVKPGKGFESLKPGMNSTCEFLTLEKNNVLVLPSQALQREGDKTTVRIKDGAKPKTVEVQIGAEGNDGFEVLSGLTEGQEVVTAELNLAQMREIQQRMQEAQQGGGLAGGRQGGPSRMTGGGGGGGGGRPGGGGGGGGGR